LHSTQLFVCINIFDGEPDFGNGAASVECLGPPLLSGAGDPTPQFPSGIPLNGRQGMSQPLHCGPRGILPPVFLPILVRLRSHLTPPLLTSEFPVHDLFERVEHGVLTSGFLLLVLGGLHDAMGAEISVLLGFLEGLPALHAEEGDAGLGPYPLPEGEEGDAQRSVGGGDSLVGGPPEIGGKEGDPNDGFFGIGGVPPGADEEAEAAPGTIVDGVGGGEGGVGDGVEEGGSVVPWSWGDERHRERGETHHHRWARGARRGIA